MSVFLNGVDVTATAAALTVHDTDIKADLGDFSAQTHLKTALAALGIPDVSAKPLYTCLIDDRLDSAAYGLDALKTLLEAIPTTMVGTDDAAVASAWTAALATALSNYTAARAAYLDVLYDNALHDTYIFPTTTQYSCTLTAHASAHTWSAWTEVVDSNATTLSSMFSAADGHISSLVVHEANQDDTDYMVQLSYGDAKTHLSSWETHSQTNKLSSTGQSKCMGAHIPAGETVYARVMCATAGSKTLTCHFRWWLHP